MKKKNKTPKTIKRDVPENWPETSIATESLLETTAAFLGCISDSMHNQVKTLRRSLLAVTDSEAASMMEEEVATFCFHRDTLKSRLNKTLALRERLEGGEDLLLSNASLFDLWFVDWNDHKDSLSSIQSSLEWLQSEFDSFIEKLGHGYDKSCFTNANTVIKHRLYYLNVLEGFDENFKRATEIPIEVRRAAERASGETLEILREVDAAAAQNDEHLRALKEKYEFKAGIFELSAQ